jgi:hypothetical protein
MLRAIFSRIQEVLQTIVFGRRRCPPECLPARFYVLNETITTSPGSHSVANVRCDPGDRVLNGGYQIQGDLNYTIERDAVFTETDSSGVVTQRYTFGLIEQSDNPRNVFVVVVCADLGTPH